MLADDPVTEVFVQVGTSRSAATFGLYRADLAKAFPQHPNVARSGFTCLLPLALGPATKTAILTVTARVHGGHTHVEKLAITFAPEAVALPDVEDEKTAVASPSLEDEAAMRLNVDLLQIDRAGLLHVGGWVVAYARIERVDVYVNDQRIGRAEYGRAREDVALTWTDYPQALQSGFMLVSDVSSFQGDMQVRVEARTNSGVRREVRLPAPRGGTVRRRKPDELHRLECDRTLFTSDGRLQLGGWALSTAGVRHIAVAFEGDVVGLADYGRDRPDVGNQFPAVPGAHLSGFSFDGVVDAAKIRAEHVLELQLVLSDDDVRLFKLSVAVQEVAAAAIAATQTDFMFELDEPLLLGGKAEHSPSGGLAIGGWSIARSGIQKIAVELDGAKIGDAYYGMRREDVAKHFSDWPDALLSGFAFSMPRRALPEGAHDITLRATSQSGAEKRIDFKVDVLAAVEPVGPWTLRRHMPAAERLLTQTLLGRLPRPPTFLLRLSCSAPEPDAMRETLHAIRAQVFEGWHILLVGARPGRFATGDLIAREFPSLAARTHRITGDGSMPAEVDIPEPEAAWVVIMEAGDVLAVDALAEFAFASAREPAADILYADERRLNVASQSIEAFFKPDWSPELLLSTNYIGRPWCARLDLAERQEGFWHALDEFGAYDMVLHCTESAGQIVHIPKLLGETAQPKTERGMQDLRALNRAVKRRDLKAVVSPGLVEHTFRHRSRKTSGALVSIIIPTCAARGLVKTCLESLKAQSTHKHIEIICVDNILDPSSTWKTWLRETADIVVEILEPFNWSRFNNLAAARASGAFLLFLNDDIEITQPDWLEVMLEVAERAHVGVVGPQLLYPDGKVQHAGLFLSGMGVARHAFRFCDAKDPGYFGLALTQRDVVGVTGASMLMRREVFDRVGGFEESHAVVNNDLDFCLKTRAAGFTNVYTPFASLIHHELASRASLKDEHDVTGFNAQWGEVFYAGDPCFHRNLSPHHDSYRYEAEPAQLIFAGHPLYVRRAVKRILAVKVDHIGDFMTAFPAFQRIKAHFPESRLYVLAAPAAVQLAALEPAIDEIIPFEFFHARSGLGQKEVGEAELAALQTVLAPLHFDLAMDLRKHPDTRKLLQYAGAAVTAGFEWKNDFPWLDITRPFEGDERFVAKRFHIADELINLVDTVAAAGDERRAVVSRPAGWVEAQTAVKAKFADDELDARRVVCLHPASGNALRQWPLLYFAALIDRLVQTEDVTVAIIGGPDETDVAERLLAMIQHKDHVVSMVGRLKLAELPYFIESCALFVGNNSGPQHMAAALGVPTVGIHSGVVDAREWGPLGDAGIAVNRDMTCSPCYLAKIEDCHRAFACLHGLGPADVFPACQRLLQLGRADPKE